MGLMPSIIGRGRQVGVFGIFAADMERTRGSHLHRTGLVKPGNYYAGHHKAQGVLVTVTRSGRTKLLDPRCDLRNNASTGFAWRQRPGSVSSRDFNRLLRSQNGGKALAEVLYRPFKFTVIAALPECWKMNFEEVGIALCRTLTDEPDLLNRVLSSLESAVLDEIVRWQERNEPLNPADLSESIVAAIAELLSEALSMSRAFTASLGRAALLRAARTRMKITAG
jgi:hypothetical protein